MGGKYVLAETLTSAHEPAQLKQCVSARQNAMKAHFDHKHRVQHSAFQKGDNVHIKKPVRGKKAHPKFTPTVEVMKESVLTPTS